MGEYQSLQHVVLPVYDETSRILILGTFPSAKSREMQFFYGHKRNRFWKILAKCFEEKFPETIEERKALILRNHVAIWDVIDKCDIIGSSDSSIKNVVPNDLSEIFQTAKIRKVLLNGKTSYKLYHRYCEKLYPEVPYAVLPSTSPANAIISFDDLFEIWKKELYTVYDEEG